MSTKSALIPDTLSATVRIRGKEVHLTNLTKPFWPDLGITKGDVLRYYADISAYLLPHLKDRAMVMKRYPNGAYGEFFFMKRTPSPHPDWLETCAITHASGNTIHFPLVNDLPSLLWVVNLGCIDLNPWYARCDDVNRPDYLHFDLDPTSEADISHVREAAQLVVAALRALEMTPYLKTSGSKGMHVYVPIVRGPLQKEVWQFAKNLAQTLAAQHPKIITAEYRIAKRPKKRVLVDYNQNAWGRTLASIYSVRPKPSAPVSAPVTFRELVKGVKIEDFTMRNMKERLDDVGDLWRPLTLKRARYDLGRYI